ncbi:MAG: DUF937 domain-containing protein [Pelistega sp.]|nr:DUF937 domain-containing protein [Pelistega sp.]
MRFNLEQLFQSPIRDIVLQQLTKNLGLPQEGSAQLFDKALSITVARMARKSLRRDSASTLFGLLKNTSFAIEPSSILSEQSTTTAAQVTQLVEQGKQVLPALFVSKAQGTENYLANTTNMPADTVRTTLGLIVPLIFSFFKDKIDNNGLTLTGMTGYIGDQAKNIAPFIDQGALDALGIKGSFDDLFLALEKAPALFIAGASVAGDSGDSLASSPEVKVLTEAKQSTAEPTKSSAPWKWLIPIAVVLAALLAVKSCTTEEQKSDPVSQAPAAPSTNTDSAKPATEPAPTTETTPATEPAPTTGSAPAAESSTAPATQS